MRIPLVFPDVELWATGYLRSALDARSETVFVSNEDTENEGRRVIFRDDGGWRANETMQARRFGCRVFGTDKQDTSDLAALVAALLEDATGDGPVKRVTVAPPFPVPDPTGPMRYFTGELFVTGTPL